MRISNKYLRNRLAKTKARKKAKRLHGEFSYKAYMPYGWFGTFWKSHDEQIKDRQDYLDRLAIDFSSGGKSCHAKKWFKKEIERCNRRQVKASINKICKGYDDVEIPTFKYDADWEWF
jgi:hypothetical protein